RNQRYETSTCCMKSSVESRRTNLTRRLGQTRRNQQRQSGLYAPWARAVTSHRNFPPRAELIPRAPWLARGHAPRTPSKRPVAGLSDPSLQVLRRQAEEGRAHATREDATREDATREDATREAATREEATREEANRQDAKRKDANRQEATREDETREDTTR